MLKKYFFLGLTVVFTYSFSICQVVDTRGESDKNNPNVSYLKDNNEFYIGVLPKYSYREMAINEDFVSGSIEEFEAEEGKVISNFMVGLRTPVLQEFLVDLGIGFFRNRDFYRFEDTDTLYQYTNTYRHISFPVKFSLNLGNKVSFLAGVGVTPKAFMGLKSEITFRDSSTSFEQEEEVITREGFNLFVVDASANLGVRVELNENIGFHFLVEGDYQLNNSYDKMSTIIRNAYTIGGNIGLIFRID